MKITEENKLRFKIGDKCYHDRNTYVGKILHIYQKHGDKRTYITTDKGNYVLENITNKVVIHTPTKDDFEFILKHFNRTSKKTFEEYYKINEGDVTVGVNGSIELYCDNEVLHLTIDEYMLSQGIKPLFVTNNKVNIYEGQMFYIISKHFNKLNNTLATTISGINIANNNKTFSTSQAAQQYLDTLNSKFKTADLVYWVGVNPTFAKIIGESSKDFYILEPIPFTNVEYTSCYI